MPICLRLLLHCVRRAASRAVCTAGNNMPTSMPMIVMTTSNSTSVNASGRHTADRLALASSLVRIDIEHLAQEPGLCPGGKLAS